MFKPAMLTYMIIHPEQQRIFEINGLKPLTQIKIKYKQVRVRLGLRLGPFGINVHFGILGSWERELNL